MPAPPRIPPLDGVRALAVLAVLATHAGLAGVPGGFVGVDVFFVLSGFLITSLLLDERNRSGRADLGAFWARRARRLLPAALVMVTTVVALRGLFRPDAVAGLRDDALAAALWVGNWRFATQGTDYFSQGGTASPLQHTWSLGVEEQFYLVWPLVLVMALAGVAGTRTRGRRVVTMAVLGTAASVYLTWELSARVSAGRVYFGTDVRAQELLIGAALAGLMARTWRWYSVPRRARRSPQRASEHGIPLLLGLGALATLGWAVHTANGTPGEFHHGLLLVVSLASAALIASVMLNRATVVARLLSLPPLVFLGRISYGVYLWHWPVFGVVTGARTGLRTYELAGLRFCVTVALAILSAAFVEYPALQLRVQPRRLLPAAAGAMAVVLAFTLWAAPAGRGPGAVPAAAADDLPPGVTVAQMQAAQASRAGHGGQGGQGGSLGQGAQGLQVVQGVQPRHLQHDGPMRVSVFGDSIGWTLAQYLPATPGIDIANRAELGCGIVGGGPYRYFGTEYEQGTTCDSWPDRWAQEVLADQPDEVLLVVGRWETMDRVHDGEWTHVGDPVFDSYLAGSVRQAVQVLGSTGARVIVASEPYNRRGERSDGSLYPEDDPARVDAWNAIVRAQLDTLPQVVPLDLGGQLSPEGKFTWNVDGVQVRSDGVHLTPRGAAWLAPWLADQLRRARV